MPSLPILAEGESSHVGALRPYMIRAHERTPLSRGRAGYPLGDGRG
jgi:hypothetical protein